jgi:hypothetical protein
MSFFIYGGSTLETMVPVGDFRLKYATGKIWCSEAELFGPINKAEKSFRFERRFTEDGDTLSPTGLLNWYSKEGANLRTARIPRESFLITLANLSRSSRCERQNLRIHARLLHPPRTVPGLRVGPRKLRVNFEGGITCFAKDNKVYGVTTRITSGQGQEHAATAVQNYPGDRRRR